MIISEDEYLAHYGTPRHSGRYPWGSGGDDEHMPRRSATLADQAKALKSAGMSESKIAEALGMKSTTELRAKLTLEKNSIKQDEIAFAQRLREKGLSNGAIGERLGGKNESYVRTLLAPGAKEKAEIFRATADMLKAEADKHTYIDVGANIENHLGVSKEKLNAAVAILKEEGYSVVPVKVPQVNRSTKTERKVLVPPGITQRDAFLNQDKIRLPSQISSDSGKSWAKFPPPLPIHPDRVHVRYAEDGGAQADGVIYVRPGVPDVSLGKARYAQVRVQVGDGHFLKGMAMYKDDLPEGTDLVFNTNKTRKEAPTKFDAMKPLKEDKDFPFGAVAKPVMEHEGTERQKAISSMNIVNEEGNWRDWSRNISAQALSKQAPSLAQKQLDLTYNAHKADFDEIKSLTNPAVKKKLLEKFAEGVDSSSVHLKAAALERQNWHVILPVDTMKPNEIYAPRYKNGEAVVLIRYPHGGKFEIPELTVNNHHPEAKKLLGDAPDAVGIHHSVAERLSGADFDGDTVIVIPNNDKRIKHEHVLDGLKGFDPKVSHKLPDDAPQLSSTRKQALMGDISNLITDMTLKGAPNTELVRAVRHSMVVIDAEKHHLDYKRSFRENGIADLKSKYQYDPVTGGSGAATIISRAKSKEYVPERELRRASRGGHIDPTTGALIYEPTNKTKFDAKGNLVPKLQKSTKLAEATDAHALSSGTRMEHIYAEHSNRLKSMANEARLEYLRTPPIQRSASARKAYAPEVASLEAKLHLAEKNAPLERQAHTLAQTQIKMLKQANPNLEKSSLKKMSNRYLEEARIRVDAGKEHIDITDKEWAAIQAGAVSNHRLERILNNADLKRVRELATPKNVPSMSTAKTAKAVQMLENGFTRAEVAARLGVSISTLDRATMSGGKEVNDETGDVNHE